MINEKRMISFLQRHGFKSDELKAKTSQELQELYTQSIYKQIQSFTPPTQNLPFSKNLPNNPFISLKTPEEIYNLDPSFILEFSFEDLILNLHKQFRFIPLEKVQKILHILIAFLQEKILGEIAQNLSNIPKEDRDFILEIYERQKEQISHLVSINNKLHLPEFREKFESILKLKTIIAQSRLNQDEL